MGRQHGPQAGGNLVEIYGENFVAGSTVTFDGSPATNVVVVNANKITCNAPSHTGSGPVPIRVTSPNGQFGEKAAAYSYD